MEASRSVSGAGSTEHPTRVFLLAANHAEAREFARHYSDAVIVDDVRDLPQDGGVLVLCGYYYDRLGASAAIAGAIGGSMRVMFQRTPEEAPRFEREHDFSVFDLKDLVACGECGTLRARTATYCSTCRALEGCR